MILMNLIAGLVLATHKRITIKSKKVSRGRQCIEKATPDVISFLFSVLMSIGDPELPKQLRSMDVTSVQPCYFPSHQELGVLFPVFVLCHLLAQNFFNFPLFLT